MRYASGIAPTLEDAIAMGILALGPETEKEIANAMHAGVPPIYYIDGLQVPGVTFISVAVV